MKLKSLKFVLKEHEEDYESAEVKSTDEPFSEEVNSWIIQVYSYIDKENMLVKDLSTLIRTLPDVIATGRNEAQLIYGLKLWVALIEGMESYYIEADNLDGLKCFQDAYLYHLRLLGFVASNFAELGI